MGRYEIRKLTGDLYIGATLDNNTQYLAICFVTIAIGMGCILYSALANAFRKLFLTKGEVVQGIIFDVETTIRTQISLGNTDDNFWNAEKVTIRFTTKKQEWITADLDSASGFIIRYSGQYKQGDKVLVIYKPDNPYDFYVVNPKINDKDQIIFAIAGFVFIGVGIYFLITAP